MKLVFNAPTSAMRLMNAKRFEQECGLVGARRRVVTQLDELGAALRRHQMSDEAIHRVRKHFKRVRAGLRLLRQPLGDPTYRRHNRSLRDAAQPMTAVRDTKVLIDTSRELFEPRDQQARGSVAKRFHNLLLQERRMSKQRFKETPVEPLRTAIRRAKQDVQLLSDQVLTSSDAGAALTRAYKKARNAYTTARSSCDNEHLHEWRKQVKYFVGQLQLVQPSKRFRKLIEQGSQLADYLGNDHDLAILDDKLVKHSTALTQLGGSVAPLINKLQRRRMSLQRKAFRLGKKLFADKPSVMAKQFKH